MRVDYRTFRKLIVLLIGVSVILIGAAMIVLPGPAIIVIPAGLAILATEFAWASRLLRKMKQQVGGLFESKRCSRQQSDSLKDKKDE